MRFGVGSCPNSLLTECHWLPFLSGRASSRSPQAKTKIPVRTFTTLSSRCPPGLTTSTATAWRHSDEAFHHVPFWSPSDDLNDRLLSAWTRMWRRRLQSLRNQLPIFKRIPILERIWWRWLPRWQLRSGRSWLSNRVQRRCASGCLRPRHANRTDRTNANVLSVSTTLIG